MNINTYTRTHTREREREIIRVIFKLYFSYYDFILQNKVFRPRLTVFLWKRAQAISISEIVKDWTNRFYRSRRHK